MNERQRLSLGFLLLGAFFLVLAVVYPALASRALERFGVRAVAATAALLAAAGLAARLRWRAVLPGFARAQPVSRAQLLGVVLLLGAAALSGQRLYLLLLPALAYLYMAWIFWKSLGQEMSIVHRAALVMQPHAPDFIDSYCRKLTGIWCALFLANAGAIAALALWQPLDTWKLYTERLAFAPLLALGIIEFFFRKWWFRNYTTRPFDRLLARLMPPENTARGRRSLAFIREMRARLAAGEEGR
ncbi:MAG TPA: hypothetical protein VIY27_00435 [Myxococcota bacterium]